MSKKLDATIVLGHCIITALKAAKELQKHDKRAKQLVEGLSRIKANMMPIIQEESDKISKEEEEFNSFSNSKSEEYKFE